MTSPAPPRALSRLPLFVFALAGLIVLLQLAFGGRYGLFRDEFYYLACADHPDYGYVDHPALSVLVLLAVRGVLGDSLLAVRLVPALLGATLVVLGALLARELDGGRFAQSLAALAVAIAPQYLAITGFYSMNSFDLVFWALAALLVARLVKSDDPRLWLPLGLVIGLGLANKISLLFFSFGLGVAVLLTPPLRAHLRRREPWLGGLVALGLFAPYVIWNARHEWATLEFMQNATRYKIAGLSPLGFLLAQIPEIHPFNLPLWVLGLGFLLLGREGRRFRALGVIYVAALCVMAFQKSKPYYLGPAYPMLLAAGAVALERFFAARSWGWARPLAFAVLLLGGALSAPFVVPILPVERFVAYQQALGEAPRSAENQSLGPLPQHFADRFGWREQVAAVAQAYESLSPEERGRVLIATDNYGEAGALNYYGRAYGLPRAVSQHNNFYLWGPGRKDATIVITVGIGTEDLREAFEQVEVAGKPESPYAMPYEMRDPIHVCRGLKAPLEQVWRAGKHYI